MADAPNARSIRMDRIAHGVVRGNVIELREDIGLADGDEVVVVVRTVAESQQWGQGIRRSAGAWADHPELDSVFERIQQERRSAHVE